MIYKPKMEEKRTKNWLFDPIPLGKMAKDGEGKKYII